jgi:hypothetical protein
MAMRDVFPGTSATARPPSEVDELIEEMLDHFAEWREEVAAVREAYRLWCAAPSAERDLRFGVYLATLDQEEAAATMYAVLTQELRAVLLGS